MVSTDFSHLNALVVDDDPFMRDLVTRALAKLSVGLVKGAGSGAEAIQLIKEKNCVFHVLLCDLQMPDMDGIEVLRHLAGMEFDGGVILFSGADERILRSAVSLARAHYLNVLGSAQKPVKLDQLREFLAQWERWYNLKPLGPGAAQLTSDELKTGLARGNLMLYFQPQIALPQGQVIGVEALARWRCEAGVLGPGSFIPLAEQSDLIEPLTRAVIEQALSQTQSWNASGQNLRMAINISVAALSLDLPEFVERACLNHGVTPNQVTLELTETHLDQDLVKTLEVLTRIRLRGLGLSIDDFGTGYSSLERLKRAPFDELKIDGSFVHGATKDRAARAIFESSVALGKQLTISVLAEGVETQEEMELANLLGCDAVQGYYIARPMPAEEFERWLGLWPGLGTVRED